MSCGALQSSWTVPWDRWNPEAIQWIDLVQKSCSFPSVPCRASQSWKSGSSVGPVQLWQGSVSASASCAPHLGSLLHLETLPCNCTEMALAPVCTLKPPASFIYYYFLLLWTFPSPFLHLDYIPVDISISLIPTGLGRNSLAHCTLTLLIFFIHMQLIKIGKNFKACAIFWTDYEFFCSLWSKTCYPQGLITKSRFYSERGTFSHLHSLVLEKQTFRVRQTGPCSQRGFLWVSWHLVILLISQIQGSSDCVRNFMSSFQKKCLVFGNICLNECLNTKQPEKTRTHSLGSPCTSPSVSAKVACESLNRAN